MRLMRNAFFATEPALKTEVCLLATLRVGNIQTLHEVGIIHGLCQSSGQEVIRLTIKKLPLTSGLRESFRRRENCRSPN